MRKRRLTPKPVYGLASLAITLRLPPTPEVERWVRSPMPPRRASRRVASPEIRPSDGSRGT